MSADKDRAIRREKQKRAKESKRQQRKTGREAPTTGSGPEVALKDAT